MASRENTRSGSVGSAHRHGPFFLQLEFKKNRDSIAIDPLNIEPQHIKEFTITLDINRLLPAFRIKMDDANGIMTHILPFDHNQSKFHVQLAHLQTKLDETTLFSFDVYRRFPDSNFIYDIEGLLSVKNLFSPGRTRAFSGTIKSTIEALGSELGMDEVEVSAGLDYKKTILQPGWSNAKLINYLKKNVIGNAKEANFYCFVKCVNKKNVLVFKSVKDFSSNIVKRRFTFTPTRVSDNKSGEEYWPILQYRMFDNYKLLGVVGTRRQESGYYDYNKSQFVTQAFDIDNNSDELFDYHSFCKYHAIDADDMPEDNLGLGNLGRNNRLTQDFIGRTLNTFHQRITDLSKLWIDIIGAEDMYPGDIVDVYHLEPGKLPPQYRGYWMVERVVHVIGNAFITRLLLTRNGYEPSSDSNLLKAKFSKEV